MHRFTRMVCTYGMLLCFMFTATVPVYAEQGANPAANSTVQAAQTTGITSLFKDVTTKDSNLLIINYLANRELMKGYPDKTFHPLAKVTRAEAAVLMVRAAGLKPEQSKARFKDVDPKYWAINDINTAIAAGYLRGYPDGKFRPDSMISRAEGVSLFLRLSKQPDEGVALPTLTDVNAKHWAARPVAIALAAGMTGLTADKKRFLPDASLNRSDMARMLGVLLIKDLNLAETNLPDKLQVVKGTVSVTRAGSQVAEEIKESTTLQPGDLVTSGGDGTAEIKFPDGTGLFIKEKTKILFKEGRGRAYIKADGTAGTAVEWLAVELKEGKMFGALAAKYEATETKPETEAKQVSLIDQERVFDKLSQGTFKILATAGATPVTEKKVASGTKPWWQAQQTKRVRVKVDMPWGMAAVRGTFWENSVDESGHTSTNVLNGEAEMSSGGKAVVLKGGQSTVITQPDAPPAPPAPMTIKDKQDWIQTKVWAQERAKDIQTNKETELPPPPVVTPIASPVPKQQPNTKLPQPVKPELPKPPVSITDIIDDVLVKIADGTPPPTPEPKVTTGNTSPPPTVAVNGVTLDKYALVLKAVGDTATLTANVFPDTASNKVVNWTSSDTAVATVTNGVVTPLAAGETIITATTKDGNKVDTATVKVIDSSAWVAVNGILITGVNVYWVETNRSSLSLYTGHSPVILVPKFTPGNATNRGVTWSSDKPEVATVSAGGVVVPIATGTATITATSEDGGYTATCTVTVYND